MIVEPQALLLARIEPFIALLGKAAHATRRQKQSMKQTWLEAASALFPLDDNKLDAMSMDLLSLDHSPEALEMCERLAEIYPNRAISHFRVAHVLQRLGDSQSAIPHLRRACEIDPDLAHLRNNLAAALMSVGAPPEEIIDLLDAAVARNPGDPEPWINLATQKLRVFDLVSAVSAGAKAVALAPDNALACNNYAQALKEAECFEEAEHHAERALHLSGQEPVFKLNLGLLHLLRGKYPSGWEGYGSRWLATEEKRKARPVFAAPAWEGQSLHGKTLLVWGEEGNGDAIQFSRFIPRLADLVHAQGGSLLWNAFPQFGDLMARSYSGHYDQYVTGGVPDLPPYDFEFSLLDSARRLEIDDRTLAAPCPYLVTSEALDRSWRARLADDGRLKVGLVWTGSPDQGRNPFRSVDLARYAAHFGGIDNVAFYSLQLGAGAEVTSAQAAGFPIEDLTGDIQSYDDTAALVNNLDLVITICTSVAHLAGALGKPTWIILDVNPHWVWRLKRRDSLWYPTVRLYRQPAFHQWDPVLSEVAADLRSLASETQVRENALS